MCRRDTGDQSVAARMTNGPELTDCSQVRRHQHLKSSSKYNSDENILISEDSSILQSSDQNNSKRTFTPELDCVSLRLPSLVHLKQQQQQQATGCQQSNFDTNFKPKTTSARASGNDLNHSQQQEHVNSDSNNNDNLITECTKCTIAAKPATRAPRRNAPTSQQQLREATSSDLSHNSNQMITFKHNNNNNTNHCHLSNQRRMTNYNYNRLLQQHQTLAQCIMALAGLLLLGHTLTGGPLLLQPCEAAISLASTTTSTTTTTTTASGQQQYFEVQPEPFNLVSSGQDVRLRCLIRNRQGECTWVRDGLVIGNIKSKYAYARQPDDGDCSLWIRNTSVHWDDGKWQCQVTGTDVDQAPLQSRQVSLVVLVAPERPQFKDIPPQGGNKLIIEENTTKSITCEIRGGNPAPLIEWQLDGKNITKEAQLSSFFTPTSASSQRVTQSKLRLADIKRTMNGKNLTCFGVHQLANQSASMELDVQYVPSVSVAQREYSIVEGSPLSISCQVDSNPSTNTVGWRLVGEGPPTLTQPSGASGGGQRRPPPPPLDSQPPGNGLSPAAPTTATAAKPPLVSGPNLEFHHISRHSNQDVYECSAQNALGISAPVQVRLNVLFAPAVLNSTHSDSVELGAGAQLMCQFEGNPAPEIKWFYVDPLSKSASALQLADNDKRSQLTIRNVTYRNEGDYFCEARNYINGQVYSVRSSNIMLDIFGEPQFLLKSPIHAKAVQGSRADVSLAFCSDPPPHRVFWQFGSFRLDVRLNASWNGHSQQALQQQAPPLGTSANQRQLHSSMMQRFQAQPLQPIQRRDSNFAKIQTCFEATLSLLDPELTDQRDYTLTVFNERGYQSGVVRLRVSSPLSPVLMITSAFVTICGLFLCSLLVMFVYKKRRDFLASGDGRQQQQQSASALNGQSANGNRRGSAAIASNGAQKAAQAAITGLDKLASEKSPTVANGNANGTGANGTNGLYYDPAQQVAVNGGTVNGAPNGLANGASNPAAALHYQQQQQQQQQYQYLDHQQQQHHLNQLNHHLHHSDTGKGLQLLSMASSDTSCNDQKQLLDRNCSSGSDGSAAGDLGVNNGQQQQQQLHRRHQQAGGSTASSGSTDRSTANSTPSQMNHISVDDELNLAGPNMNGSYQAAESAARQLDDKLSAAGGEHLDDELDDGDDHNDHNDNDNQQAGSNTMRGRGHRRHHQTPTATSGGLIYANIDYDQAVDLLSNGAGGGSQASPLPMDTSLAAKQQLRMMPRRQQTPVVDGGLGSPDGSLASMQMVHRRHPSASGQSASPLGSLTAGADGQQTSNATGGAAAATGGNQVVRSSVGATIAMMNSLAAAAAAASASPNSNPNGGALNGAINQQLANSRQLIRKPGPPKPPKPSIQQRNRFYQQQQQQQLAASAANGGGLVMIGQHQQQQQDNQLMLEQQQQQQTSDLAAEYSRLAFPARAEL